MANTKPVFDPANVEVVNLVTIPLLKKQDDKPIYVIFEGPIYKGKEMQAAEGKKQMEPAHLARIINMETGEQMEIICNEVMKGSLNDTYPDNGYVGKAFMITQMKVEGKRYKNYSIKEIKNPFAK